MEDLKKKREELEKKYSRMMDAHTKKPHWHSEGAYQDSAQELRNIYDELFKIAQELGDPVPVWF